MNFREVIGNLVTETLTNSAPSWLAEHFVTSDGNIDKDKLIEALEKWVEAMRGTKNYPAYKELVDSIKSRTEVYESFLYRVSYLFDGNYIFDWQRNIDEFWLFLGLSIRKIVGVNAMPISLCEIEKYPFGEDVRVTTEEQKNAISECIEGYGWDPLQFSKLTCPALSDLLPKKIKKKKGRGRKSYINYIRRKANEISNNYSLAIYGRIDVFRFDGDTVLVPEQFSTYAYYVNYLKFVTNMQKKQRDLRRKRSNFSPSKTYVKQKEMKKDRYKRHSQNRRAR